MSDIFDRITQIIDYKEVSKRTFSKNLGLSGAYLSEILRNKRGFSYEILEKIVSIYPELNASWLLTGEGEMLRGKLGEVQENTAPQPRSEGKVKGKVKGKVSPESPLEITVKDEEGARLVPMINVRAAAGWGEFPATTDKERLFAHAPTMSVPEKYLSGGENAAIEVRGESMYPTLFDGDYVLCHKLEDPRNQMRDSYIYMLVTDNGLLIKRVLNRLNKRGEVLCKSDNREFQPFKLIHEELHEAWEVKARLSFRMPDLNNSMYHDVQDLKDKMETLLHRLNIEDL